MYNFIFFLHEIRSISCAAFGMNSEFIIMYYSDMIGELCPVQIQRFETEWCFICGCLPQGTSVTLYAAYKRGKNIYMYSTVRLSRVIHDP